MPEDNISKKLIAQTINTSPKLKKTSEHWDNFIVLPEKTKLEIFKILEERWTNDEIIKMEYLKNLLAPKVENKNPENIVFHPEWEIHIYTKGRKEWRFKWLDQSNRDGILKIALLWDIDILLNEIEIFLKDQLINEKIKRDLNTKTNINKSIINFILEKIKTDEKFKNIDSTLIESTIQQVLRDELYDKIIERLQNIAIDIIESLYKDLDKTKSKYINFINFYWKPHLIDGERKNSPLIISWWIIRIKNIIIEYYKITLKSIEKQKDKIKGFEEIYNKLNESKITLEYEKDKLTETYDFLKKKDEYILKNVRQHELNKLSKRCQLSVEWKKELIELNKDIWILKDKLTKEQIRIYSDEISKINNISDNDIMKKRSEIREIEEKMDQNKKIRDDLQNKLDNYLNTNDNIKEYNTIIQNLSKLLLNPFPDAKK